MIKCEVIVREFTIKDFKKLKNIVRFNPELNKDGKMYRKDTFECDQEMVDYLTGGSGYELVKVIEVIPEEVKEYPKAIIEVDSMAKEIFKEDKIEKPKKKTKKSKKK